LAKRAEKNYVSILGENDAWIPLGGKPFRCNELWFFICVSGEMKAGFEATFLD
jgi:hypothetical protein